MKFKLSRKKKKQYQKDIYPFFKSSYNKECYEWFYFKRKVIIKGMVSLFGKEFYNEPKSNIETVIHKNKISKVDRTKINKHYLNQIK